MWVIKFYKVLRWRYYLPKVTKMLYAEKSRSRSLIDSKHCGKVGKYVYVWKNVYNDENNIEHSYAIRWSHIVATKVL